MLYRSIPKVDVLLADEKVQMLIETYSRETVMESIHLEMNRLRAYIAKCEDEEEAKRQIEALTEKIERTVSAMHTPNMRMVMNGTGTILHTNLGRAPISPEHMKRVAAIATGYSNLEYNGSILFRYIQNASLILISSIGCYFIAKKNLKSI